MLQEIEDLIEHLNNIWESDCDPSIKEMDGCNVYHSESYEAILDKDNKKIYINFEISLYPYQVAQTTKHLMMFVYPKQLKLLIGESFFIWKDSIYYGEDAIEMLEVVAQRNVETEMRNLSVLNSVFDRDDLPEC